MKNNRKENKKFENGKMNAATEKLIGKLSLEAGATVKIKSN